MDFKVVPHAQKQRQGHKLHTNPPSEHAAWRLCSHLKPYKATCLQHGEGTLPIDPSGRAPCPYVDEDNDLFPTTLAQWLWVCEGKGLLESGSSF